MAYAAARAETPSAGAPEGAPSSARPQVTASQPPPDRLPTASQPPRMVSELNCPPSPCPSRNELPPNGLRKLLATCLRIAFDCRHPPGSLRVRVASRWNARGRPSAARSPASWPTRSASCRRPTVCDRASIPGALPDAVCLAALLLRIQSSADPNQTKLSEPTQPNPNQSQTTKSTQWPQGHAHRLWPRVSRWTTARPPPPWSRSASSLARRSCNSARSSRCPRRMRSASATLTAPSVRPSALVSHAPAALLVPPACQSHLPRHIAPFLY